MLYVYYRSDGFPNGIFHPCALSGQMGELSARRRRRRRRRFLEIQVDILAVEPM